MEKENRCACRCLTIPGFCFKPSDDQLVGYYLSEKIAGRPLCCNHTIAELKIYDDKLLPWEIIKDEDCHWSTYSNDSSDTTIKKTMYVFTELCKKNTRVTRRSGAGSWKGQNTRFVKNVAGGDNIGYKKLLTFYEDDGNNKGKKQISYEGHGHWTMNEFSLLGIDNYVVCKITKEVEISKQGFQRCDYQQEQVDLPLPDDIVETNLQWDAGDMNMMLGDERQFGGGGDHDDQPLGADWDNNGWQTELYKQLGLDISDDMSAQVVAPLNDPSQVQSVLNFHVEDAVAAVQVSVWDKNEKKYESCKCLNGADNNNDVIEISDDDDDDDDSIQELPMIGAADDPLIMLPINVGDQEENNRACTNFPYGLSNFLNYMDGNVGVQETPIAACEDLQGSSAGVNQISNDFSYVEASLAVEPTNATLDGSDVMLDIPFYDMLNLGWEDISNIFEDQPRKRLRNGNDDDDSSKKKQRYLEIQ